MSVLYPTVSALLVGGILLSTGLMHLKSVSSFGDAIAQQGVVPRAMARTLALVLVAAEVAIGGTMLAAFAIGRFDVAGGSAIAGVGLLAAYAGHAFYVAHTRKAPVPCGCSRSDLAMSGSVAIRALMLMVIAVVSISVRNLQATDVLQVSAELAVAAMAAASIGILLWFLPYVARPTERYSS